MGWLKKDLYSMGMFQNMKRESEEEGENHSETRSIQELINIAKMKDKDAVYFWGGEFSQWYPSKFEIDGTEYNCAEQYMMEQKAKLFGDDEMVDKIMNTTSPKEQKAFGRKVKNFEPSKWEEIAYDTVVRGSIAKFKQNSELLTILQNTENREIVEASAYDTIWGIGLSPHDPLRFDKKNWKGTNLLGKAIMDAREILK